MKLVEEMRYKSVVIPIINGKYVSVRDAKHREVTFVTGGCKLREISISSCARCENCARRRTARWVRCVEKISFT